MNLISDPVRTACIGIGATIVMDAWLLLLQRLRVPTLNFAHVGRWVGHWPRGRWRHDAIAGAEPVAGETAMGWATHYLTGVLFAGLLVATQGPAWLRDPTPGPALAFGLLTVLAPWLLMQPALGAGLAASRTAAPWSNRLRSVATHTVFGAGLYLTASILTFLENIR